MKIHRPVMTMVVACMLLVVGPFPGTAAETRDSAAPTELIDSAAIFGRETTAEIQARLIIDEQGRRKERTLRILVEQSAGTAGEGGAGGTAGERKVYAQIIDPPFLDRMRFLSVTDARGNESRWTATSTGVRRIADSGAAEELFGSEFTVQDFTGLDATSYELRELPRERLNGREMRVVVAVGGGRRAVYPGRIYWIDADTALVRRIEYFTSADALSGDADSRGEPAKRYQVEATLERRGAVYPEVAVMTNPSENSTSTLRIEEFSIVEDIPDRNFNRAALR
jgi:hypothetical protein